MTTPFATILRRNLSRRQLLQAGALGGAALVLPGRSPFGDVAPPSGGQAANGLLFRPITGRRTDAVEVADGYRADVVLRWGDPLGTSDSGLDTRRLRQGSLLEAGAAAAQQRQFGYNCDALQYFPGDLPDRGLLCVNHEYTNDELMFPGRIGLGREGAAALAAWSRRYPAAARLAIAAHGASVVELQLDGETWRTVAGSPVSRRITGETPIEISGPARGHVLLRTRADPTGTRVLGMLGNCAGGRTPWGTYLTAEENIDDYFGSYVSWSTAGVPEPGLLEAHRRFRLLETSLHGWEYTEPRFDLRREPREPLRFGWIVEIDPRDPTAPIRKRTALGRFSHEGATCAVARDGRVAVYTGDDDTFEYLYKFVTRDSFDPARPAASRDLLDHGVLHAARFDADGTGEWLALEHGRGPLTAAAGFADAGEVAIKARAAADLLGATPMDRPEDVAVDPMSGRVYVAFTKNGDRLAGTSRAVVAGRKIDRGTDASNPRPVNDFGHILEITEDSDDAAATRFRWNVFLLAGDPRAAGTRYMTEAPTKSTRPLDSGDTYFAGYADRSAISPMACPDNLGFDPQGNLWIVTDGAQPDGNHNGAFAVPVRGPERGRLMQFMSAPRGAEVCGCEFTPDGETLFLSIQHPGEGGTLDRPLSDWPDGGGLPPRPSVVAIRRRGGGRVGS